MECTASENHHAGIEALSQLHYLQHFQFAMRSSEITQSELELVSLCMFLMPRLMTVGRKLRFSPKNSAKLSSLRTSYHNAQALQYLAQHQHSSALEEFYTHSIFWTADTVRLLPNLKRLHIIMDNFHIPDTLTELSLYYNYNLQTVRAFTPSLRLLSLYNCNLSGVPYCGLLAWCPNLEELHLIECLLDPSNVALDDDVCQHSRLRVLTLKGMQGVPVDGVVSRLLQAPLLHIVGVSVKSIPMAEVDQLVQQVHSRRILQMVRLLSLKGENLEPLVMTVRVFLPKAYDV